MPRNEIYIYIEREREEREREREKEIDRLHLLRVHRPDVPGAGHLHRAEHDREGAERRFPTGGFSRDRRHLNQRNEWITGSFLFVLFKPDRSHLK